MTILLRAAASAASRRKLGRRFRSVPPRRASRRADFNGDRLPDLAIASLATNTVTVLLRQAGRRFRPGGARSPSTPARSGRRRVTSTGDGRAPTSRSPTTPPARSPCSCASPQAASRPTPARLPRLELQRPPRSTSTATDAPDIAASGDDLTRCTVFLNTTAAGGPCANHARPAGAGQVRGRAGSLGTGAHQYPPGYTARAAGPAKGFVPLTGAANIPIGSQVRHEEGPRRVDVGVRIPVASGCSRRTSTRGSSRSSRRCPRRSPRSRRR